MPYHHSALQISAWSNLTTWILLRYSIQMPVNQSQEQSITPAADIKESRNYFKWCRRPLSSRWSLSSYLLLPLFAITSGHTASGWASYFGEPPSSSIKWRLQWWVASVDWLQNELFYNWLLFRRYSCMYFASSRGHQAEVLSWT